MKKLTLFTIFIMLTAAAGAQVKHTVTQSTINFQIKNLGFNTHGTVSGLQGNIQFDPAKPESSIIEATVDANTINTGNDMRDNHLKEESYFDVATYPKITMKSVSLKRKSGDNYEGQFNLTIKGKTQLVTVPFTYTTDANTAEFKGSLKIKRTTFGIGSSSMVMSDDVLVNIDVKASK